MFSLELEERLREQCDGRIEDMNGVIEFVVIYHVVGIGVWKI